MNRPGKFIAYQPAPFTQDCEPLFMFKNFYVYNWRVYIPFPTNISVSVYQLRTSILEPEACLMVLRRKIDTADRTCDQQIP